jgi:hypothetical protein
MRTRPSLAAGVAAAALALTACGTTGGTSGGTQGGHAASVPAGPARADTWLADLKDLAQVKRHAVDPVRFPARQPQLDTSELADLRELAKVKRDVVWKTAGHTWGR